jgi:hypothetical protein
MKEYKKYLPWTIRGLIAFLFLLSAVAKLYPSPYFAISTFEVKQLYPMGFSENSAAYFSRILIGIEFALGILLLQNHFLKRIVIPATILMLAVFTTHLTIVSFVTGGNSGNCGCFGSLLPMTPIEAIIKNLVAISLLLVLWKIISKNSDRSNFWVLSTITFGFILMLFMLAPIKGQTSQYTTSSIDDIQSDSITTQAVPSIAIDNDLKQNKLEAIKSTEKTEAKILEKAIVLEIPKTKSGYAKYFPKIDTGKQLLCFFVPGCDHCRATAKEITEIKNADPKFPKISIIFMDEEANLIPEFFQFAGAQYPYKIIDVIGFWKELGTNKDVPGVKLLDNGKEIKYYFGTKDNKFNAEDLKKLIP